MRFALVGQPNCGKSTLFNQVAGYKAETGNFAGTTVTYTESKVRVLGEVVDVVDLPGTYTLAGTSPAEREAFNYLASREIDVIVNVIDASQLAHGLTLTLELLELQRPMVVALNMMDEAMRLGIRIDGPQLQSSLGAPVLPLVASKGRGVKELFITALRQAKQGSAPRRPPYEPELESAIQAIASRLDGACAPLQPEPAAIKLIERDADMLAQIDLRQPSLRPLLDDITGALQHAHGDSAGWLMGAERRRLATALAQQITQRTERRVTLRDRLDDLLLHPVLGYVAFVAIMLAFFQVIYGLGTLIEKPIQAFFDDMIQAVTSLMGAETIWYNLIAGLLQGISGGIAIVLPYLVPFLIGLSILEDTGYLPRVAFLMDALMHRLGLHGKAIVPFILGYGCNVPAIMSTRILEDRRDRFLAAALATMVPCAARLAVVFGLVAFYLGPVLALFIYVFNLFVIAVTGRVISRFLPEDSPGLILEMPVYRIPTPRAVINKAWFRIREFVVEAWPILIVGSIVLAVFTHLKITPWLDIVTSPITGLLGLPQAVGTPLLFGILRKELSLVMLGQALGSNDFKTVLTAIQMMTFTVFVVFYIPCLGTLAVLRRELGSRYMLAIVGLTLFIAFLAALVVRVLGMLLLAWA